MASERDFGLGVVVGGKTLAALLYFKIASAFLFENGLTLVGAIVLALVFAIAEECVFTWLARTLRSPTLYKNPGKWRVILTYVLLYLVFVPIAVLISVGFSPATVGFSEYTRTNWFGATLAMVAVVCVVAAVIRYFELKSFYRLKV